MPKDAVLIEGVPISCGREECRRFGLLEFRPMKPLGTEPEANAFAARVRAGSLAFPFNKPCVTRVTKESSGYMVWARAKDDIGERRRNPYRKGTPRHTAFELGRPRLTR